MFNVTFEDGPFFGDYPEESLFSSHNLLEIYRDKDSSNLFFSLYWAIFLFINVLIKY